MSRWVFVARAGDVAPGHGKTVQVGARYLALFNDAGEFFAIADSCPHQGASLGEGTLHEGRVICPWHSWVFDLCTGRCPGVPQASVECYPARRCGENVEVEIPD